MTICLGARRSIWRLGKLVRGKLAGFSLYTATLGEHSKALMQRSLAALIVESFGPR